MNGVGAAACPRLPPRPDLNPRNTPINLPVYRDVVLIPSPLLPQVNSNVLTGYASASSPHHFPFCRPCSSVCASASSPPTSIPWCSQSSSQSSSCCASTLPGVWHPLRPSWRLWQGAVRQNHPQRQVGSPRLRLTLPCAFWAREPSCEAFLSAQRQACRGQAARGGPCSAKVKSACGQGVEMVSEAYSGNVGLPLEFVCG